MQYQPPTHAGDGSRSPPSVAASLTLAALLVVGLWSPVAALVSIGALGTLVAATAVGRGSRRERPVHPSSPVRR